MSLLRTVQQRAARNGLNLFGLVDARRFDACQPREQRVATVAPGCGTIIVLGTGGRSFWVEWKRQGQVVPNAPDCDTVDELAVAGARTVANDLEEHGARTDLLDARWSRLNFGRVAEAAGFGIVSPVSGMLLHPTYGPWVRVRAALLVEGMPFGAVPDASITDRFKPCCTCDRPCVTACPPTVHDGRGNSDRGRCAEHRSSGGCLSGCESRMACPVGREHRDDGPTLHAHSMGLRTVQRWFGLGLWRMVPRIFRGGPRA